MWKACWQTSWGQSDSANRLFKVVSDFMNTLPNVLSASSLYWSHCQFHLFWNFSHHITSFVCTKICISYLFLCNKPPQMCIICYLMVSVGQEFRNSVVENLWLGGFCEAPTRCWLGVKFSEGVAGPRESSSELSPWPCCTTASGYCPGTSIALHRSLSGDCVSALIEQDLIYRRAIALRQQTM